MRNLAGIPYGVYTHSAPSQHLGFLDPCCTWWTCKSWIRDVDCKQLAYWHFLACLEDIQISFLVWFGDWYADNAIPCGKHIPMKTDIPFRHSCSFYFISCLLFQRVRKGALKPVSLSGNRCESLAVICLKEDRPWHSFHSVTLWLF